MEMLILASCSPRRKELLERLDIPFSIEAADVDENLPEVQTPEDIVLEIAARKAHCVYGRHPESIVLAADTIVYHEGEVLGKPESIADAVRMLRSLSGKVHTVYTGGWIIGPGISEYFCEKTLVEFYELSEDEILSYVSSGEPMDKAGAYGIQGRGGLLVKGIEGDFYNVMGLPIGRVCRILRNLRVIPDIR